MYCHRQHAGFGHKQPAGPAATTFHKILHGMPAFQNLVEVSIEYRSIKSVALEASSQKERTASPKYRSDDRDIQVNASRHVRNTKALFVDDVSQQQVVEMTPVAGYVDDFLVSGDFMKALDVIENDAVVHPVPEPTEKSRNHCNSWIGNVRGNFLSILACLVRPAFQQRAVISTFRLDDASNLRAHQHLINERSAV